MRQFLTIGVNQGRHQYHWHSYIYLIKILLNYIDFIAVLLFSLAIISFTTLLMVHSLMENVPPGNWVIALSFVAI